MKIRITTTIIIDFPDDTKDCCPQHSPTPDDSAKVLSRLLEKVFDKKTGMDYVTFIP